MTKYIGNFFHFYSFHVCIFVIFICTYQKKSVILHRQTVKIMRNALFQARQFAFWMLVVVLFRALLHIPDAEGMLPVNQLELFSSSMDIFMYGLVIIYASYLLTQRAEMLLPWYPMLRILIGSASIMILLHLFTLRLTGVDPDVFWPQSHWWFKALYLLSYAQWSAVLGWLSIRLNAKVTARWWAFAISLTGLPIILILFFLGPIIPFIHESFGFMLFKDLSMDIAFVGFYWSLSSHSKKLKVEN